MIDTHFGERVHEDDLDRLTAGLEALRTQAQPGSISFRFRHKDGSWIPVEASGNTYMSETGEQRLVTILRDVSELRRAELAVRHSERLASTGTLAAGVAHQINNPVGSILAASEFALILAEEDDIEGVKAALRDIAGQARRCGDIVRSLLQFSRREHSERVRVDLRESAAQACALARTFANNHGVMLDLDLGDDSLHVVVNTVELEQVIVNLVCNAIESRPASRRVQILLTRDGEFARLAIIDDGAGIERADLARVFDPFFTTRLEDGGSGLGLSVAHGIVDEHGGAIRIESEIGKGTRVTVELPIPVEA